MSLFVLDTDILTLFQRSHPQVVGKCLTHPMSALALTVITVEEQLSGWYSLIRKAKQAEKLVLAYQRLADAVPPLAQFQILPLSEAALKQSEELQKAKLGLKKMDLRIAAITLQNKATLVTRNTADFQKVPNLLLEDWSK